MSHSFTDLSSLAEAISLPSVEKAIAITQQECPCVATMLVLVLTKSQTMLVRSSLQEISVLLFVANVIEFTIYE